MREYTELQGKPFLTHKLKPQSYLNVSINNINIIIIIIIIELRFQKSLTGDKIIRK